MWHFDFYFHIKYFLSELTIMNDDSIIKNSSMLLAYLGGLGWGSAYFYGWGVSAYYGFPWWYVGVGPDNIARSLFHAISLMAIFIIAWGVGILLFFLVKQKARIHDLSFLRLFLAAVLFFIPIVIEFSLLTESFLWELFLSFYWWLYAYRWGCVFIVNWCQWFVLRNSVGCEGIVSL